MASFDFIEASVKGYDFVWTKRDYLLLVAIPVLFVKVACLLGVFVLGVQKQFLLQGLVLLPGIIIEAIFIIGLIRYYLHREPIFIWGKTIQPPEEEKQNTPSYSGYYSKRQCYQAGIASYILIKVIHLAIVGLVFDISINSPAEQIAESSEEKTAAVALISSMLGFGMLAGIFWAFRLMWLYIPITIGFPATSFLKMAKGFNTSFYIIVTWLICFLPLVTFFIILMSIASGIFPPKSAALIISNYVIEALADIAMTSIQVIAITHGIRQIAIGQIKSAK